MGIKSTKLFLFGLVYLFLSALQAQMISLDTTKSAELLVIELLLGNQSDLIIENVQFTGSTQSIGAFYNDWPEALIDSGIILSTGNVFDAQGPNDKIDEGSRTSARRDINLQAISTAPTTDAAVLEFDLIALRDSLEFEYIFASEEYPEYVNKGVNDVFGFFIKENGSKSIYPRNIALLPDGRTTVSIDNVNHRRNEQYFLPSDFLHVHSNEFWQNHKAMAMRAQLFQFDGFTIPLKAKVLLKEGRSYHFKIAIADVGDRIYDSAVLIRAKSLSSKGKRIPQAEKLVSAYVKKELNKWDKKYLGEVDDKLQFDLKVQFNTNEAIIREESYKQLNQLVDLLKKMGSLQVLIIGHTDDVGSDEENMTLSINRAKAVRTFLVQNQINPERLSISGKGESSPLQSNLDEASRFENRRVEFQLKF